MEKSTFRGSEWRMWDFHIHTPFSFTHQFTGDFSLEESKEFQESFDTYVKTLFTKAIENDIAAIGITDYFTIAGYKKIKKDYLGNDEKLSNLFDNNEILIGKIKKIFVFPNIEMRLNCFVGRDCENIDFHVIFSNEVPIEAIEANFIQKLEFIFDTPSGNRADKRSISPMNIRTFGEVLKREQGFEGDELTIGYRHLSLDINDIVQTLQQITDFKDKYLTIVDDDNLGNIPWTGRDHSTRKMIIKMSNLQFSNNKSNIEWGLGLRGYVAPEQFVNEFGHFLPSVTGSDAHSYDDMFVIDGLPFCWVKANANFEGLRQIIFEPSERVKIQTTKPEEKNGDKVIDRIEICDPGNFSNEPIYLSENLTCIIGGKSTGKSLLLREIAKAIDADQVYSREKEVYNKNRKEFHVDNVKVFWKDGSQEHQKRKIIYIPQTYLNRLTDEEQEITQIDELIEKVLFQNNEIHEGYDYLCRNLHKQKELTGKMILEYNSLHNQYSELEDDLKENGESKTINQIISEIQTKIDEIAKKLNISDGIIDEYNTIKARNLFLISQTKDVAADSKIIGEMLFVDTLREETEDMLGQLKVPETKEKLMKRVVNILSETEKMWTSTKIELINELQQIQQAGQEEKSELLKTLQKLQPIIEKTEEIKLLTQKKSIEEERKKVAERLEVELKIVIEKKEKLKKELKKIFAKYREIYNEYISIVNKAAANFPNSDMTFNASVIFRKDKFIDTVLDTFNKKTLTSETVKTMRDGPDNIKDEYIDSLPEKLLGDYEADRIKTVKNESFENVLKKLFDDWFNIDYSVNMGRDSIKNMSPGKKALVLLRLLLELAQSDFPILIDQPEDDLDNRSIYNDIVKYIKSKKKERQIIVVTHNANVVLGSDSELVVVANQDGEDCKNSTARFEYRLGAIESNDLELNETGEKKSGILYEHGIRDQICDILEGGADAFNLRENKYSIV